MCSLEPEMIATKESETADLATKDLFDVNFMQNFSFSPTLSLNNHAKSSKYSNNVKTLEDSLIPTDQILDFFKTQDKVKGAIHRSKIHTAGSSSNKQEKYMKGKTKLETTVGNEDSNIQKKRLLSPPPNRPEPAKKSKNEEGMPDEDSPVIVKATEEAEAGIIQPRQSP